jgi:hypothetical protein
MTYNEINIEYIWVQLYKFFIVHYLRDPQNFLKTIPLPRCCYNSLLFLFRHGPRDQEVGPAILVKFCHFPGAGRAGHQAAGSGKHLLQFRIQPSPPFEWPGGALIFATDLTAAPHHGHVKLTSKFSIIITVCHSYL